MDEWIWMRNDATGGVTRFPAAAREGWEARGWVETEEPVVNDLAPEEQAAHEPVPVEAVETTEAPAVSGQEKGTKNRG